MPPVLGEDSLLIYEFVAVEHNMLNDFERLASSRDLVRHEPRQMLNEFGMMWGRVQQTSTEDEMHTCISKLPRADGRTSATMPSAWGNGGRHDLKFQEGMTVVRGNCAKVSWGQMQTPLGFCALDPNRPAAGPCEAAMQIAHACGSSRLDINLQHAGGS